MVKPWLLCVLVAGSFVACSSQNGGTGGTGSSGDGGSSGQDPNVREITCDHSTFGSCGPIENNCNCGAVCHKWGVGSYECLYPCFNQADCNFVFVYGSGRTQYGTCARYSSGSSEGYCMPGSPSNGSDAGTGGGSSGSSSGSSGGTSGGSSGTSGGTSGGSSGTSGGGSTSSGGTSGSDAATCAGYAAPATTAPCTSTCSPSTCQANGCYNGYYCELGSNHCVPKPAGC